MASLPAAAITLVPSKSKSKASVALRAGVVARLRDKRAFRLLAETFQALGDASRVQIVWVLSHGEFAVGELAGLVGMSQPAVSHHLRTLRNLRLVTIRRDGRTLYYSLDDEHIEALLKEGIKHVEDFL